MKVCFITYGCRLNRAEALEMEARYIEKGWEVTEKHSDADAFVIRGCSVTRRAESECAKMIAHLRKHYPLKPIHIFGCYEDKHHVSGALLGNIKEQIKIKRQKMNDFVHSTSVPTRTARAYLKVQDGCSCKCAFCIVPKFRGESVSLSFDDLLVRAEKFIEAGYHEIVVTGCNLALYSSNGKRLADLLAALAALSPDCRYRIGSLEPGACAREVVDLMAETPTICRFLHIPIQSGSDRILSAMRRPYHAKDVIELATRATAKMPLLGLGCDIITGFPGEQDIDHLATRTLLKRLPMTNAHVFPFSKRRGTPAESFFDQIAREIRHSRAHEIAKDMSEQRKRFATKFLGKPVEVLLENEKTMSGWTSEYFACTITNKALVKAKRKEIVRAFVTDVDDDKLKATVLT